MCIRDRGYGELREMLEVYLNKSNLIDDEKITNPILNIITTVSYTHLDVYKRQVLIPTGTQGINRRITFINWCSGIMNRHR